VFKCRKQLKDVLTTRALQETVMRILDVFISTGSPHHWVDYLMTSQDATTDVSSSDATVSKFHQLITETREVLTRLNVSSAFNPQKTNNFTSLKPCPHFCFNVPNLLNISWSCFLVAAMIFQM